MWYLIILGSLAISLSSRIKKILDKKIEKLKKRLSALTQEYGGYISESKGLKQEKGYLEKSLEEIIALYNTAKEICKYLNADKVFSVFRDEVDKYISLRDCKFLKSEADLAPYHNYEILPLIINKGAVGYLVADGVREQDKDKFQILVQQFQLGVKRALLYEAVQELSITDPLTHALNHRYWLERFKEEIARSKKFKYQLSCLVVDIDHFKEYNDRYGHLVGDAILRDVSYIIKEAIRQIDIVGKYGGDELAIVLSETDREGAKFAAERMRQAIEAKHIRVYDEDLKATVSIGISVFPADGQDIKTLFDRADAALYRAKEKGRNRVCVWEIS